VAYSVTDSDILNRLTTVSASTAVELTKAISHYYRRPIGVRDVLVTLAALDARGWVTRRLREEAGHRYGAAEYQLTTQGARARVRLGATDYDPFTAVPPR
jgi:hypothetical protein